MHSRHLGFIRIEQKSKCATEDELQLYHWTLSGGESHLTGGIISLLQTQICSQALLGRLLRVREMSKVLFCQGLYYMLFLASYKVQLFTTDNDLATHKMMWLESGYAASSAAVCCFKILFRVLRCNWGPAPLKVGTIPRLTSAGQNIPQSDKFIVRLSFKT